MNDYILILYIYHIQYTHKAHNGWCYDPVAMLFIKICIVCRRLHTNKWKDYKPKQGHTFLSGGACKCLNSPSNTRRSTRPEGCSVSFVEFTVPELFWALDLHYKVTQSSNGQFNSSHLKILWSAQFRPTLPPNVASGQRHMQTELNYQITKMEN